MIYSGFYTVYTKDKANMQVTTKETKTEERCHSPNMIPIVAKVGWISEKNNID